MAITSFVTPHDGAGTVLTFNGNTYSVTDLTWSKSDIASDNNIDTSTLDQVTGEEINYQPAPLIGDTGSETGWSLQFNYIGNEPIEDGTEGTISVTGGVSISGNAYCTESSVTAAVNDVVRGSATLRLERPTGNPFRKAPTYPTAND